MAKLNKAQRADVIYAALKGIFEDGSGKAEWTHIVGELRRTLPFEIKNWFEVRGVIQYMLNKGEIARTSDLHNEVYVTL